MNWEPANVGQTFQKVHRPQSVGAPGDTDHNSDKRNGWEAVALR